MCDLIAFWEDPKGFGCQSHRSQRKIKGVQTAGVTRRRIKRYKRSIIKRRRGKSVNINMTPCRQRSKRI